MCTETAVFRNIDNWRTPTHIYMLVCDSRLPFHQFDSPIIYVAITLYVHIYLMFKVGVSAWASKSFQVLYGLVMDASRKSTNNCSIILPRCFELKTTTNWTFHGRDLNKMQSTKMWIACATNLSWNQIIVKHRSALNIQTKFQAM